MALHCLLRVGVVAFAVCPPLGMAQPELPDTLVQSLVATAQENFWGRAVLSSGETVQPIDDTERNTPVIPFVDSARVVHAARPLGQAIWCDVEWQPSAPSRSCKPSAESRRSEKQIAFIGVLFGLTQRAVLKCA